MARWRHLRERVSFGEPVRDRVLIRRSGVAVATNGDYVTRWVFGATETNYGRAGGPSSRCRRGSTTISWSCCKAWACSAACGYAGADLPKTSRGIWIYASAMGEWLLGSLLEWLRPGHLSAADRTSRGPWRRRRSSQLLATAGVVVPGGSDQHGRLRLLLHRK